MRAQGRRAASGPVWAGWFLELEELLARREATGGRCQRPSGGRSFRLSGVRARSHGKA